MEQKKYVSFEKLSDYDALIKTEIRNIANEEANTALTSSKAYTDNKTADLLTASVVNNSISSHNSSTSAHSDIRESVNELTKRTINGKEFSSNITLSASDVGADAKGAASSVQANLNVVNENLTDHIENDDIHFTAEERTKLGGIEAEANKYSHPNSGVTAGTYKSVTVNAQGHITGGTNPTTLEGYGITDAEAKGAANNALADAKEYTDTVASGKANTSHNHDTAYDSKGAANSALASAKEYADSAATTAANKVKNDLLNNAGGAYDTLKELGDLIDDNADAIDALEIVAAGKADKTHSHAINDVTNLQSALDGKADKSHGTHVSYSDTAPVMDGTASVGSASTVARSDHKHPTDTSRAAKTDLDTHTSDSTIHITSTERSNWNAAKTHADSAHAPSNAEKNQNAFSNIKVNSTTVAADTATDTVTFVGSNVTITPDATNNKITFAVAEGSTSAKGLVQLTDSTSSTSQTTAATPNSVKSAYDLANVAKTNAATAQSRADSAYTLASGKVDSLSDLGITATATELNYVYGVTANIQTQLNGKAASDHSHSDYLGKTTYEYNKELALGSTGKVCIGKFPMYDSNISVEIKSTTNTTYNGTLVIATQNINTTGGGSYAATVYGDANNALTDSIKIQYGSGSNVFSVYINLPSWSKNLLHIQCVALAGTPTDIATTVSEIPSAATIVPTNALKSQLDGKADSSHGNHVPTPETADNKKFLRNDNTWQTVTPANIGAAKSDHTHSAYAAVPTESTASLSGTLTPVANTIYYSSLTGDLTISTGESNCSKYPAHFLLFTGGAQRRLSFSGAICISGDLNTTSSDASKAYIDMPSGTRWEMSIYRGQVVIKRTV